MIQPMPADPVKTQLIAARRDQILDAATKVFGDKGYHRATIKDVARAAGIADGTIYNYFENKSAVLLGILHRLNETSDREAHFEQAHHMDLREWLRGYIQHRMKMFQPETFAMFRVLLSEVLVNDELRELYWSQVVGPTFGVAKRHFRRWMEEGTIATSDPVLAMRAVAGMFLGVTMLRLIGDPQVIQRWDKMPDVLVEMILNGLRKDPDE
jgi:TetR/AcrR family fatty acid metabolism transcriptional regulator